MGVDAEHGQLVSWRNHRFLDLTGALAPIVQAPMAGACGVDLAVAAIRGGALGSLPCALLSADQVVAQAAEVRRRTDGPLNLNFFCHTLPPAPDETAWAGLLAPFYAEFGVEPPATPAPLRRPFDADMAAAVEAARPNLVSFHFGLPDAALLDRVRATGARIIGNATTRTEAIWLAAQGCDAIIVQGYEAGGHAGYFLDGHHPVGLLALIGQVRAAIDLPLIAAGGIADARAIAAALTAGADAVQIGTAYLATPESTVSATHRALLGSDAPTVFTNLLTGRRARGFRNRLIDTLGPVNPIAPPFPHAATALAPLRAAAGDEFGPLWAGQSAHLARPIPARELTETLAAETLALLEKTP